MSGYRIQFHQAAPLFVAYFMLNFRRRKSEPSKPSKSRSDSEPNLKEKSSTYVPSLVNATQPYYVQPSEDKKLAPSAEMLHYQYQRDRNSTQPWVIFDVSSFSLRHTQIWRKSLATS